MDKKFKIEFVRDIISTESKVPEKVTDMLLKEAKFSDLPKLTSSSIEDFFIEKINKGYTPEQISKEIPSFLIELKNTFKQIEEKGNQIDWENTVKESDKQEIKRQLAEVSNMLGADDKVTKDIESIDFKISDSIGTSYQKESAVIAKYQIVRKAMDYMRVFPEADFKEVVRTLSLTSLAHEAGHIINDSLENYTNRIPVDESWEEGENRLERFAEFFARTIKLEGIDINIRVQEKLIQVKKVKEFWSKIKEFMVKNPTIGTMQLFNMVNKDGDKQIGDFVWARQLLYGVNQPEHYAAPYSLEELVKYKK